MKKTASVFLLLAALYTTSFAQDRPAPTPEQRAERQTEMMGRMLSLTPEQKTKIYEVNIKAAKQSGKFSGPADSTNFRVIQEARENAYKKILTEDQYKKYEETKARRQMNRGTERRGPVPGAERSTD